MCIYAIARFSCRHELWGRRTKLCTIGEDYRDGLLEADCIVRGTHPLKTMQVPEPCYSCFRMKALPLLCRAKLQEARSIFKERWPEVVVETEKCRGEETLTALKDADVCWGGDVQERQVEAPKDVGAFSKPKNLLARVPKPVRISRREPVTPPQRNGRLPLPKRTPPSSKQAAPAQEAQAVTPSLKTSLPTPRTTPSRASRLAVPARKTPEKSASVLKAPAKSANQSISKLQKPRFARK